MHGQWEDYRSARARALAIPPLTAADEEFLNTLGPWSRSNHPNLTFLGGPPTGTAPSSRAKSSFKPRYHQPPPEHDRIGYTGFLSMGRPLRDDQMPPSPPPAGSVGDLKMRVTLTRRARSQGSLPGTPLTPSPSQRSRRDERINPNFEMEHGVPAGRHFCLHTPCRDNNHVQTKLW
mmetsp:Transcript_25542/g.52951  ORF Transcript_25542/g.52951 Transcript_25542/m.52951 type:complete len:176 (+) Transcript_25542:26-553(+)